LKELYFTPETIETKAQEMRQAVVDAQRSQRFVFKPEKSAMLVLDMQTYFLEPTSHAYVPSARPILPGLRDLAAAFTQQCLPVIFTRHLNTHADAQLMASWWRDLIREANPLSKISAEFDLKQAIVLEKSQYDAFYHTELEHILHSRNVSQLVIGGVMTHLCCETTTRTAFGRGFEPFFLVDGTATYHESFHRASLLNLTHGFAELKLVSEILEDLTGEFAHD